MTGNKIKVNRKTAIDLLLGKVRDFPEEEILKFALAYLNERLNTHSDKEVLEVFYREFDQVIEQYFDLDNWRAEIDKQAVDNIKEKRDNNKDKRLESLIFDEKKSQK